MALYKKALKYSLVNSKTYNIGELVNYMQVDAQKLKDLPIYVGGIIFLPLQLVIAIFIMYEVIGLSFLAGFGAIILTFIFNLFISKYFTNFQKNLLLAKDDRMKLANEIISAIKIIKVNAWEYFFLGKITEIREKEIKWLIKSAVISVLLIFSLYLTPMLILSATFTMYTLTDHSMNAENVFTLVSTFVVVQHSIRWLPLAIAFLVQVMVSIKRLQKFLLAEEIDVEYIKFEYPGLGEDAIILKNGYFYWDQEKEAEEKKENDKEIDPKNDVRNFSIDLKDAKINENLGYSFVSNGIQNDSKYTLKDLNLTIKKGSITAIIGEY